MIGGLPVSSYSCAESGSPCITGTFLVNGLNTIVNCCYTTNCNTGIATDTGTYTIWCYVGIMGGSTVQQYCASTCQVRNLIRI